MDLKALIAKMDVIEKKQVLTEEVKTKKTSSGGTVTKTEKGSVHKAGPKGYGNKWDGETQDQAPAKSKAAKSAAEKKAAKANDIKLPPWKGNVTKHSSNKGAEKDDGTGDLEESVSFKGAIANALLREFGLEDQNSDQKKNIKEANNPYTGADAVKFAAMSPKDQEWLLRGGQQPNINDPNILARAPNGGMAAAPATQTATPQNAVQSAQDTEIDKASGQVAAVNKQAAMDKELDAATAQVAAVPKVSGSPTTAAPVAAKPAVAAPAAGGTYTIKPGDTLSKIALATGLSVNAIAAANGISNPNLIRAGATLKLPAAGKPAAAKPGESPMTATPAKVASAPASQSQVRAVDNKLAAEPVPVATAKDPALDKAIQQAIKSGMPNTSPTNPQIVKMADTYRKEMAQQAASAAQAADIAKRVAQIPKESVQQAEDNQVLNLIRNAFKR